MKMMTSPAATMLQKLKNIKILSERKRVKKCTYEALSERQHYLSTL
jgi:hypothetical protein